MWWHILDSHPHENLFYHGMADHPGGLPCINRNMRNWCDIKEVNFGYKWVVCNCSPVYCAVNSADDGQMAECCETGQLLILHTGSVIVFLANFIDQSTWPASNTSAGQILHIL